MPATGDVGIGVAAAAEAGVTLSPAIEESAPPVLLKM